LTFTFFLNKYSPFSSLYSGIANLYTESGNGLNCNIASENTNNPIITGIVDWRIFQCHLAIASLVVCWVNIGLLLLSLLISWRRAVELSWVLTPSSSFNDDMRGNMVEFRGNMEGVIDSTNER
ncbi:25538_t:CDS:1, partial [Gigaspora rosea]